MLWTPLKPLVTRESNLEGGIATLTPGTSVTTGGTATTKGTAAQLIASTRADAHLIEIVCSNVGASATDSRGCLDILIGAATEQVLIPNLLIGCAGGASAVGCGPKRWVFPLYIPAGSRISAQAACARTATAIRVCVYLLGFGPAAPFRVGSRVTTYGVTVPDGTAVTAGTAGEGAWTQIAAATSRDHFAFFPSWQPPNDTTLTPQKTYFLDMGIGAATEEALGQAAQRYQYMLDTGEMAEGPYGGGFPTWQDVPSGTRLVARLSASGAADAAASQVAIHAVS